MMPDQLEIIIKRLSKLQNSLDSIQMNARELADELSIIVSDLEDVTEELEAIDESKEEQK
jgi:chaperonin cofactor prefoldin